MAKTAQKKQQVRRRLLQRRAHRAQRRGKKGNSSLPLHGLPLVTCCISSGWKENGSGTLIVARRQSDGFLICGCFLLDLWGVGARDCFRMTCPQPDLKRFLSEMESRLDSPFEKISEDLAGQLIWGSFYYGKDNGFDPPGEFHTCKKLVLPLARGEVNLALFGKDGKPFIIGDYDDLMRRSGGKFDPEAVKGHYLFALPAQALDGSDPWDVLWEEDEDLPPDKERLLFIDGAYFGKDFETLFNTLVQWEDLDLVEEGEEYALFGWSRPYPENHWNPLSRLPGARQSLGQLKIQGATLMVSVKGRSWMLIMNERLATTFGSGLTRGPLTVQDPAEILDARSGHGSSAF